MNIHTDIHVWVEGEVGRNNRMMVRWRWPSSESMNGFKAVVMIRYVLQPLDSTTGHTHS